MERWLSGGYHDVFEGFAVVGCVLLLSQASQSAVLNNTTNENFVNLYGPARTFAPLSGTKTQTNTFAVSPAPSAGQLIVINGSGEDLSPKSCSGLGLIARLLCAATNVINTARLQIERPSSGGYLHDEFGRLVAEVNPNGLLRSHFVYGSESHSPDYMIRGGNRYYFAKDHLGSIRAVFNAGLGVLEQSLHYDEFGRVLHDSNPGFQPFGFAGGHYDFQTGLVRFGARDYDAETGRWTAKDPILFAGGSTNLYGYSNNDPVNFIDTDGLSAEDVNRIRDRFNNSVNRMTNGGQRRSPGWLNNMLRSAHDISGGRVGSKFLGCGEQTEVVQSELQDGQYDDVWDFAWEGTFDPLPHQRIRATSSNPNDPVLTIDPHRNQFQTGR